MSELKHGLHANRKELDQRADEPPEQDDPEAEEGSDSAPSNAQQPEQIEEPDLGDTAPAGEASGVRDSGPRLLRRTRKQRKKKKRRRRLTLAVLPTALTLSNGVCGLGAIAVAMSVTLPWSDETKLLTAGILIFGGMLFDALDGSAARMTGQESRFGAELDSLCDAITFGTAPAVIVWRHCQGLPFKISWAIGVLFALCVLIRLARFNVETTEDDSHEGFEGLPSPAAAGTIAAFAIAMPELAAYATDPYYSPYIQSLASYLQAVSQVFIAGLTLLLAYLMVSRFQYPHVFQQLLRGRRTPHQIGQAMFVVIGALLLHWLALPIAFCYYTFASPVRTLLARWRGHRLASAADGDS